MKNIQPKSTKLLRERIEATKNKNRVDIATSPTSSHDVNNNDSVIFEEEEEVTANSREAVPDNENNNQQQTQSQQYMTNFNQNKTYIPAPPTMKILSDEEVAMRSRNEVRKRNKVIAVTKVQFTTNAKQIQDKQLAAQIHKNKLDNKVQSTPQSQYKQTPQAPKMNKQQSNYKKVLSPSELNDSFI
ncbi:hypothetical protein M9Y10_040111 [Tritrichomonas musculus]|uniref:Uncharacterized protein n=1 Tax=Tritrichomonas musculus TaxID=1915356 RepID=A0ABR2GQ89_9EUKA